MSEAGNMVRSMGRVFLILAVLGPVAAAAENPPRAPMLTSYIQQKRLRFDTILGRIKFATTRSGGTSSRSTGSDRKEQLSMRISGDSATVDYELSTSTETLSIKANGDGQLQVLRVPQGDSPLVPVDFMQAAGKPVSLTVGREGDRRVYEAPSLWHLLLEEPEVVQARLVPLLKLLQPDTNVVGMAAEIERELVRVAAAVEPMPDRERWAELVRQLGDDSFAQRQSADRQLRRADPIVVAYLRNLDTRELDAEQQFRIHHIVRSFARGQEKDTPQIVAKWLTTDARTWLILLGRDDESTRRLAARRLERLLGEPIAFDPGADAAMRGRQLEQLRHRVGESRTIRGACPRAKAAPG